MESCEDIDGSVKMSDELDAEGRGVLRRGKTLRIAQSLRSVLGTPPRGGITHT